MFFILAPLPLEDQLKSTLHQAYIVHSLSSRGNQTYKEISYSYKCQSRNVDKVQKAVVGVSGVSVQGELPKRSHTFCWVVDGGEGDIRLHQGDILRGRNQVIIVSIF